MEIKIQEIQALEPVKFNFEDLKKELTEKVSTYKKLVYTEDNIKDAKADRALLNKLSTAINDEKKRVKNKLLEPFTDFENKCKELMGIVDEANKNIDTQIKAFEDKQKNEKIQEIEKFFEENAEELIYLLNLDKIWNPKWLNVTYKIEDIKKEIKHVITKARQDLKVIKTLETEFENTLIDFYFKTLNLSETMGEKVRLEEQKKKVEKLQNAQNIAKSTQDNAKNEVNTSKSVQNVQKSEELQQIDFRVWATEKQKFALRDFLKENNIKYGKVK